MTTVYDSLFVKDNVVPALARIIQDTGSVSSSTAISNLIDVVNRGKFIPKKTSKITSFGRLYYTGNIPSGYRQTVNGDNASITWQIIASMQYNHNHRSLNCPKYSYDGKFRLSVKVSDLEFTQDAVGAKVFACIRQFDTQFVEYNDKFGTFSDFIFGKLYTPYVHSKDWYNLSLNSLDYMKKFKVMFSKY